MPKWFAFAFAALAIAAMGIIVGQRPDRGSPASSVARDAGLDATADAADAGHADAGNAGDGGEPQPSGGGDEPGSESSGGSDAGATLLDGSAPPGLAADAPKSVVFGAILVQYRGAQGALPTARSREEALQLATQLAADAKTDFKAALAKGDKGSLENAGRMPRGMLEPAPEYVLFSLPKDGVSEPVDTPRGFWIVHRIE
jgi:hypothetical protein